MSHIFKLCGGGESVTQCQAMTVQTALHVPAISPDRQMRCRVPTLLHLPTHLTSHLVSFTAWKLTSSEFTSPFTLRGSATAAVSFGRL